MCSECGDRHDAGGILAHTAACSFRVRKSMTTSAVLFGHPDLVDLEVETSFWYLDDGAA